MPIINNVVHEPEIKEIREEKQVIELIKEVQGSVLNYMKETKNFSSLKDVLKVLENGVYEGVISEYPIKHNAVTRIDLSRAKRMIEEYRYNSEKGCRSCKHIGHYMPLQDEHVTYCKKYEKADTVDAGYSPRIDKFYKQGCTDKEAIFSKTIEQILTEEKLKE